MLGSTGALKSWSQDAVGGDGSTPANDDGDAGRALLFVEYFDGLSKSMIPSGGVETVLGIVLESLSRLRDWVRLVSVSGDRGDVMLGLPSDVSTENSQAWSSVGCDELCEWKLS